MLSRRRFLGGLAGAVVAGAGAGVYELVEALTPPPARAPGAGSVPHAGAQPSGIPPEQHVLDNVSTSQDGLVLVPPRHTEILTGRLRVGTSRSTLSRAQRIMEAALAGIDETFDPTRPSGLGTAVAWGLPYFRAFVPGPAAAHLPVDLGASEAMGRRTLAVVDAAAFPSDPPEVVLESNHMAVLFRSDYLTHIQAGRRMLLEGLGAMLEVTSIRKGFTGGGFGGGQSLPKAMALAAGVPGAGLIPDDAELFLGFISTNAISNGPPRAPNLETFPGVTDQWPDGYFRYGTTMALSHVLEDVAAWYALGFQERLGRMFRPGLEAGPDTQSLPQGPASVEDVAQVRRDQAAHSIIGHSASIQPVTRLAAEMVDNYGMVHPAGTSVFARADSNTIDNPFAFSADPTAYRQSARGAAGIHFIGLTATSDLFHRSRLAMDGRYGGQVVSSDPRSPGLNRLLRATHRQNFLMPPRARRSLPLAELL